MLRAQLQIKIISIQGHLHKIMNIVIIYYLSTILCEID